MFEIYSLFRLNSPIAYRLVDTSSTHDPKCQTANNQLNYCMEKPPVKFLQSPPLMISSLTKISQSPPHSNLRYQVCPKPDDEINKYM